MSYTAHFLHIPDDVLAYLLDGISLLFTHLTLHELKREGLEYNAASASPTMSFPQALASLKSRELRWRTMHPIDSSFRGALNERNVTSYYQKVVLYVSRHVTSSVVYGDISVDRASYYYGSVDEVTCLHAADVPQDLLVLLRMHIG